MPSIEVELTRDSVFKQVGPCFSEIDARAFVERGIQFFYREKQHLFTLLLCALDLFSDSFFHPTVPSGCQMCASFPCTFRVLTIEPIHR